MLKEFHEWDKDEQQAFNTDHGIFQTSDTKQTQRMAFFKDRLTSEKWHGGNLLLQNQLNSLLPVLGNIEKVAAIESGVVNHVLNYAGTVDCLAAYDGQMSVIDWKTSKRKKKTLKSCYDYPVQLAAYAGAVNQDPMYPFVVSI